MANGLKRFGGIVSIAALVLVLASTPSQAGFGGVQSWVSTPAAVADSGDTSLPWYVSLLQPLLTLTLVW